MNHPKARAGDRATGILAGPKRLARARYGPLLLGLALLLVLGVAKLTDYGASIDEVAETDIGRLSLKAYETGNLLHLSGIDSYHGPFYFMIFTVTSRLFSLLNPSWLATDGLHLTNYLTFLTGVLFFYQIALRLLPRGSALFATALFSTQPVLFGHGFINQKDIPLMVFFLASVEVGWTAVESRLKEESGGGGGGESWQAEVEEWKGLKRSERVGIAVGLTLVGAVLLDLWLVGGIERWAVGLLREVYQGRGPALVIGLFEQVAEDAYKTPLTAYQEKLRSLLVWSRLVVTASAVLVALGMWRLALPESYRAVVGRWMRRWGLVVVAGALLGMATSVRVLAPFAGLLVGAYWVGRCGRRAWAGVVMYGMVAVVTTYLTWPGLWGNPLVALSPRAMGLSKFAAHGAHLWGLEYASGDLPWFFLPTLLGLQLTLPALAFFLMGIPYSWILTGKDRRRRLLVALLWLWLVLPVAAVMLGRIPIYNNFRHVLFALPPAFVIMGFGAWRLFMALRTPALQAILAVVALAPGIVGIARLHPYEYTYYNELVGGVRGAQGRFELDYWCTSFRETMGVVNGVADPGDQVMLLPYLRIANLFARDDLELTEGGGDPDFVAVCRRGLAQPPDMPDMETVYEVRADGALLGVVLQRRPAP